MTPGGAGLAALAAAIRRHEANASSRAVPKRPRDHALYRQLRAIEAGQVNGQPDAFPGQDRFRFQIRGH